MSKVELRRSHATLHLVHYISGRLVLTWPMDASAKTEDTLLDGGFWAATKPTKKSMEKLE